LSFINKDILTYLHYTPLLYRCLPCTSLFYYILPYTTQPNPTKPSLPHPTYPEPMPGVADPGRRGPLAPWEDTFSSPPFPVLQGVPQAPFSVLYFLFFIPLPSALSSPTHQSNIISTLMKLNSLFPFLPLISRKTLLTLKQLLTLYLPGCQPICFRSISLKLNQ